jgi:hypothetical protein
MARVFDKSNCCCGACVVSMSASEGAALLSLPIIAQFILAHRKQLHHIVVLEARGMAYSAVQVVKQLSSHERIRMYRSLGDFASHAALSGDSDFRARDRMALAVARRACATSIDASSSRLSWPRFWCNAHSSLFAWWRQASLAARHAVSISKISTSAKEPRAQSSAA